MTPETEPSTKPTQPSTPETKPDDTEPSDTKPSEPTDEPNLNFPEGRVDDSWFENTLFIGDSNTVRYMSYGQCTLENAIGVIGMAVVSKTLPWLATVFARSKNTFDQTFCDMIVDIHRWEMVGYVTLGINSATIALLLGYGYSKRTMILNAARVFVFRVPVLWALQQFTGIGAEAVGITMMVSNVCTGLAAIVFAIPVVRQIRKLIREEEAGNGI